MKRKTGSTSQKSAAKTHAIAAHRLTAVRGGLGITFDVVPPPPSLMQMQHNETVIRL
jgi:hypothetical protein